MSRREALVAAGAVGLGAGLYVVLKGDGESPGPPSPSSSSTPSGSSATGDMCVLTPEQTEGPYYVEDSSVRRDVTEGRPGVPLGLRLRVQDATSCEPIGNATVEIWHCDAVGVYSGFTAAGSGGGGAGGPPGGGVPGEGPTDDQTFLRGAQRSGRDGEVAFRTIYPGWYQGRTPHIHVKVHVAGDVVHTGQLYFDETVTNAVYERQPYASHGDPTTTNASDGIHAAAGREAALALSRSGEGYLGRLTLGVNRA